MAKRFTDVEPSVRMNRRTRYDAPKGGAISIAPPFILSDRNSERVFGNSENPLARTPSGARTLDPNIKSVVLYQLS